MGFFDPFGMAADVGELKNDLNSVKSDVETHTNNNDIHVTASDKNNWDSKLDKNQGTENSGKVLGTNANGEVIPLNGYGFEYDEETKMLKYGTDPTSNLNQGIGLDDTLSKRGYAADAGAVGELKSNLDKLNEGGLLLKDGVIEEDINNWLNEHPEATTTVQDESLTEDKLSNSLRLKTIKDYVTPQMFKNYEGDDWTQAIQSAVNSNETVFFPSGTYQITSPIVLKNSSRIVGAKKYGTTIKCVGCDCFHFEKDAERGSVSNIYLLGDNSLCHAFYFNYTVQWLFDNVWIRHFGDTFFYAKNCGDCNNIIIQNCEFEFGGSGCIEFLGCPSSQINAVNILSCNISHFDFGIKVSGNNINIQNCCIQDCTYGIICDGTSFEGNTNMSSTHGLNIIGNYFEQIKKNVCLFNVSFVSSSQFVSTVSAVLIQGNYVYYNGDVEVESESRIKFIGENESGYTTRDTYPKSLVNDVYILGNYMRHNTANNIYFIDGGNLLGKNCFIFLSGIDGGYTSEYAKTSYKNMGNANLYGMWVFHKEIVPLYDGLLSDGSQRTIDGISLPEQGTYSKIFSVENCHSIKFTFSRTVITSWRGEPSFTLKAYNNSTDSWTIITQQPLNGNDGEEQTISVDGLFVQGRKNFKLEVVTLGYSVELHNLVANCTSL